MKWLVLIGVLTGCTSPVQDQTAKDYFNSGLAKQNLEDSRGAIQDYSKAIELNQNDAVAHYNRGVAKHNLGDYRGAIQDFNKAIELNPNYADAYHNRGLEKIKLKDINGGCLDLSKAGELGNATAYDAIKNLCQ